MNSRESCSIALLWRVVSAVRVPASRGLASGWTTTGAWAPRVADICITAARSFAQQGQHLRQHWTACLHDRQQSPDGLTTYEWAEAQRREAAMVVERKLGPFGIQRRIGIDDT